MLYLFVQILLCIGINILATSDKEEVMQLSDEEFFSMKEDPEEISSELGSDWVIINKDDYSEFVENDENDDMFLEQEILDSYCFVNEEDVGDCSEIYDLTHCMPKNHLSRRCDNGSFYQRLQKNSTLKTLVNNTLQHFSSKLECESSIVKDGTYIILKSLLKVAYFGFYSEAYNIITTSCLENDGILLKHTSNLLTKLLINLTSEVYFTCFPQSNFFPQFDKREIENYMVNSINKILTAFIIPKSDMPCDAIACA
ncbi:hypothetical protein SLOPH_795 [Spraguea lophii 42_110]|uniref:Uncharacterized protein n=1 Tax=Spraguea lophii (strain 42_110) TaxID=1358809 RepID=S7W9A2_SPRLO|nr:hypothetical protein SLOPH_795 [Spraguea lophii 42_110]